MSMGTINYQLDKIYKMNKYLGGKSFKNDFRAKNTNIYKSLNNDFFKRF